MEGEGCALERETGLPEPTQQAWLSIAPEGPTEVIHTGRDSFVCLAPVEAKRASDNLQPEGQVVGSCRGSAGY